MTTPATARLAVVLLLAAGALLTAGWLTWHTPAGAQSGQDIPP